MGGLGGDGVGSVGKYAVLESSTSLQVWESAAADITGRIQLIDWVKFLHILAVSH